MRRLLACALVLLAVACSNEPAPVDRAGDARPAKKDTSRPSRRGTVPVADPSLALIYTKGSAVRAFRLETSDDMMMRSVPGPDVALSPDGDYLAMVIDKQPGTDPEGYGDPYIGVATRMGEGNVTELGPGAAPHWSPDGQHIAAVTDDGIVTYDVASGAAHEVLTGQGWNVLGWSGARVAAVGQGTTVLADEGGSEDIGFEPSVVWGISPTAEEVLVAGEGPPELIEGEESTTVAVEGFVADGAWSPDGRRIVVVAVGKGPDRVVMVDTATGQVSAMDEGAGAQGNVVWAADSGTYAFVRIDPQDNLKLQAVVCEVTGACEAAFSWSQGVQLLGFSEL